ncbi:hypothetical protein EDD18DRAFT_1370521 [Armillaria luteobubalina]|uniref:Uncharacterized protein n=1 Tax=Armillaria luteobubalina TaxID=153913 RepID=A0AA39NUK1_9AGAR|nr:hypothetical protein EDD18DRAFT_1370521 [Armillaria luteobubalina]
MRFPHCETLSPQIPLSFYTLQNRSKMLSIRRLAVQLRTFKRVRGIVRLSFGNSGPVNNPALTSSTFPPSYEAATTAPLPYATVDMLVRNDIHAIDTVEPAPLYSNLYTPLEDIGMGGFVRSELATVFEEDVEEAVE